MRRLKNNKKKKDDLIEVSKSIIDKSMIYLKSLCKNDDVFNFVRILLDNSNLESDLYLYSFKHTLLGLEFMSDRNERFRAKKAIEEALPKLIERYKPLLEPSINLEIATILYDINDLLTKYASIQNSIIIHTEKAKTEKAKELMKILLEFERGFNGDMAEYCNCDGAPWVAGTLKAKFIEVNNWVTNSFYNLINTNEMQDFFSYDILSDSVKKKVTLIANRLNNELEYSFYAYKTWEKFCYFINELTARTSLVKASFKVLEKEGFSKKDLSHLKSTISRVSTLLNWLYNLVNYASEEPEISEIEEVREVYGMLNLNLLSGVSNLEKVI